MPIRFVLIAARLVVIASGVIAIGCGDRETAGIREAEKSVPPFTVGALHDTLHQHIALTFAIQGDSLAFLPDSSSLRPGKLPFHPDTTGSFAVTYFTSRGAKRGGYATDDPRMIRSCSDGGKGGLEILTSGLVEILVPADTTIATLLVTSEGHAPQRVPPSGDLQLGAIKGH